MALTDEFNIHVAESPAGGVELTVFGELDMATAPKLREEFRDPIDAGLDVTVDLRACGFMDSSGIAALVGAAWQLKEHGRLLRIRGATERIRRVLELSGLLSHDAVVLEPTERSG